MFYSLCKMHSFHVYIVMENHFTQYCQLFFFQLIVELFDLNGNFG